MFSWSELVNLQRIHFFRSPELSYVANESSDIPKTTVSKMTSNAEKPYRDIGQRIIAGRKALGLNQAAFAERGGFKASQVSNWESGLHRPGLDALITLRDTFGLSIDFIIFGNLDALSHKIAKAVELNPDVNISR